MSILSLTATIFGIISGFAGIPQIIKVFKRKSAKDLSILTYTLLSLGAIFWILYGIEINNFPIIITNIVGFLTLSGIIIGWFLYGRK